MSDAEEELVDMRDAVQGDPIVGIEATTWDDTTGPGAREPK